MTLVSLPLGASNSGTNDWADVYNNDAAITAVVNGDIRNDNLAAAGTAAIAHAKLANASAGYVLQAAGSGVITATAWSGDVTVGSTGVTAIGATKVTGTMLAASATPAYHLIFEGASVLASDATSGTYSLGRPLARQSPVNVSGDQTGGSNTAVDATNFPVTLFRFVAADYAIGSLTTKLNLRSIVSTNATASTRNFVVGLYPVTVAGTTDILTYTLGTVVASSTATHTAPSASTNDVGTSGDFTIPSDGVYALGFTLSGTLANNSAVQVSAQLRVRNV